MVSFVFTCDGLSVSGSPVMSHGRYQCCSPATSRWPVVACEDVVVSARCCRAADVDAFPEVRLCPPRDRPLFQATTPRHTALVLPGRPNRRRRRRVAADEIVLLESSSTDQVKRKVPSSFSPPQPLAAVPYRSGNEWQSSCIKVRPAAFVGLIS